MDDQIKHEVQMLLKSDASYLETVKAICTSTGR